MAEIWQAAKHRTGYHPFSRRRASPTAAGFPPLGDIHCMVRFFIE